jgi:choice-of-anchor A domain-containing protein
MTNKIVVAFVSCFFAGCLAAHADSAPFGVLSAFNVVAMGDSSLAGTITVSNDVEGRVAAAGSVSGITTILDSLTNPGSNDPWGSSATINGVSYAAVIGGTLTGPTAINNSGSVSYIYAASHTGAINFNNGGTFYNPGSSPINFSAEQTAMANESSLLAGEAANGTICFSSSYGCSGRTLVLTGTSKTINYFTVPASDFGSGSIDIEVPTGSTVVVNVTGSSVTFSSAGVFINGSQESDTYDDGNKILFNFSTATSVTVNGALDASILAPYANVTGNSGQIGGNVIAAQISGSDEFHNDEFVGSIPLYTSSPAATPEPGTIILMGSGLLFIAGLLVWRRPQADISTSSIM